MCGCVSCLVSLPEPQLGMKRHMYFFVYGNFVSRDPASPVESKSCVTSGVEEGGRDPGRISWAFSGIINDHSRVCQTLEYV